MSQYKCNVAVSCNVSVEAKKNQIQKRKKEKLPVDIIPSSEETTLVKTEQVVAVEMDVTNPKTAETEGDVRPSAVAVNSTQRVYIQSQDPQKKSTFSDMAEYTHSNKGKAEY